MNKIQKIFLTIIGLLTTINVISADFNITITAPSNGTLSLSNESIILTGSATAGSSVTLYATPTSGYYLEEIVVEPVTDSGNAESRTRIGFANKIIINKTNNPTEFDNNKAANYGGSYSFTMPSSNVSITATFRSTTSFESNSNITLAISGSTIYDGVVRSLIVTNTVPSSVTLVEGKEFQITSKKIDRGSGFVDIDNIKDAGNYQITISGIGTFQNSKTVNSGLTISKANLTITPKNKSRIYSNPNPTYTNTSSSSSGDYTYSGLQNEETNTVLTTQPTATIDESITKDKNVGTYSGVVSASGASADNYNISYGKGAITITARDVNSANIAVESRAQATLSDPTYTFEAEQYYKYDSSNEIAYNPSVTVIDPSDNNKELIENTDFSVAYAKDTYGSDDFKKPGIYKATITFKGNYSGSDIIKYYQIRDKVSLPNTWNTYYYSAENGMNMRVPEGMEAYTIGSINTTQVGTILQNYIIKGIPMMLYKTGTNSDFYPELVKDATEENPSLRRSEFIGTDVDIDMATKASGSTTYDYWIVIGNQFIRSKSGTLSAHKCYLELAKTQFSSPSLSLSRGKNTTGINQIFDDKRNGDEYYDLNGRRVQNPTKGLFIMNGKKIIIK